MEEIFGIVLSVSFSIAYVPQIVKMVSRKSSSDVSLIMLLVNGLGYGSGVVYVVMKELDAFWLKFNYIALQYNLPRRYGFQVYLRIIN